MITEECIIPQEHHRILMRGKGRKVQTITSDFDVQIKFPDRDPNGKYSSIFKIINLHNYLITLFT